MSHASKKAEGSVEELGGKIKQAVGKLFGNPAMEAKGHAEKIKGHAKRQAVKTAEHVKDRVDTLKSKARERAHH